MRTNVCTTALLLILVALSSCRCGTQAPEVAGRTDVLPPPSPAWLEGQLEPQPPGLTPVSGGTLVIRAGREPAGLSQLHDRMRDPELARYTVGPVYETLLETDATGFELRPRLAETWTTSQDGKEHLFRLREGVTFHDGSPFTAADVAATLRAVHGGLNVTTAMRAALEGLSAFEALDGRTLLLRWEQPSHAGFRQLVLNLPILPAGALADGFNTAEILQRPIGTGPFCFASWEAGALTLTRHAAYWREPAFLDAVEIRFEPDAVKAWAGFERGAYGLMTHLSPAQWREMEPLSWARDYQRIKAPGAGSSVLTWNLARPLLADARVRRALARLTPLEAVSRAVDLETSTLADCPFAPGAPGCDPALKAATFSPEAAGHLLDEAGWSARADDGVRTREGLRLSIRLLIPEGSSGSAALSRVLQQAWREGGVELKPETVSWEGLQARLGEGDFDAAVLLWAFDDAAAPLYPLFAADGTAGLNYGAYANAAADARLTALRSGFEPHQRQADRRALHQLLWDDPPGLFLAHPSRLEAARADVRGLSGGLTWHELRRVWLEPRAGDELSGDALPATPGERPLRRRSSSGR